MLTEQDLINQLFWESREKERPFFLLRPKLFRTSTGWKVEYGANAETGLTGYGKSPDEAAKDFDANFFKRNPE